MATELTWLGHGSWWIESSGTKILLDPFLDDSPTAPLKARDVEAQFILISHGHFDHVADVAAIAKHSGAMLVANYEITEWFRRQHGIENSQSMNIGGGIDLAFGRVTMTLAHHSSQLPDGTYGGSPSGFVVRFAEGAVYFACDTALFADMRRIGAAGIELAVLPIGDRYTMGPEDALEAVKLIAPARVVPVHYNTWPPIAQDPNAWASRVRAETSALPCVIEPGGRIQL
jgi:L-ascorbate metabolism protein UlaG (beta-lactamase superfamily)